MPDLESGRDPHVESFPLGYTWPAIKVDMTKPLDVVTEVSGAAWRAKSADGITWLDDTHGHIAAVVPEELVKYALRHGWGR